MKKICLFMFAALFLGTSVSGKIQMPEILSGNMVLQQDTFVKLWGKANPDSKVSIFTSWDKGRYKVLSDADGNWIISVRTPEAGYTPYYIEVSDGEKLRIDNILIGEVWLCSGQSNMEMPLGGYLDSSVENGNETIAASADKKGIRMATIKKKGSCSLLESCEGVWEECSPETTPKFSAVGYFFAERLNKILDVPVGVINCSWSGSRIECWLPREIVEGYKDIDLSRIEGRQHFHGGDPVVMYNGMLKPLSNYTIKGFLWYQGEANCRTHTTYADRLVTLVKRWREDWGLGELPFYMVEIAPHEYAGKVQMAAYLREAQYEAVSRLPHCGIVCTNDLLYPYENRQIHPCRKREVGDRLVYMALNKDYGYKDIACDSPVYKEMTVNGNKAVISFYNVTGFTSLAHNQFAGFEIAGEDRVFHPAFASTDYRTKTISVWSDKVKSPVAVRYCFKNYQIGNLMTNRRLPFAPFRTDDFPPETE